MVSKVFLVGIGMGNPDTITVAGKKAIEGSGLLVGAQRMLDAFAELPCKRIAALEPEQIAAILKESHEEVASVLLSGDVGFYSGATGLYQYLAAFDIQVIPGVSSLAYFCAKLHTTWQDVRVVSAHGRTHNAVGAVQASPRTFLLAGGTTTPQHLCDELTKRGLGNVSVHVGEHLSYPDERIVSGTAAELAQQPFDGLAVMLVENPCPVAPTAAAPYLPDESFARAETPMSKEEIRELAICKLQIATDHVVWDVGAGTGSISVEAARAAREGRVCAIEKNEHALALIEENKKRFGLPHLEIVAGCAPDALAGLPAPNCAFIGGSSGHLEEILQCVLDANPQARLCVSAITLETLSEILRCIQDLPVCTVDIVQLSVAKAHHAGAYHMMRAENPVYLATFTGSMSPPNCASRTHSDLGTNQRGTHTMFPSRAQEEFSV